MIDSGLIVGDGNHQAEFVVWAQTAEGAPTTPEAQHPVDELLAEHHLIRRVLDAVHLKAGKIRRGEELDLDFWESAVEVVGNFALLFHYAKKANYLFPAIEAFGLEEKIAALDQKQQQDIEMTLELCNAVSERDVETVQRLVSMYVATKRAHLDQEEEEVLVPAKALLSEEVAGELRKTFDEMESPPGKHRKTYLDAALRVIEEAGLPDPRSEG